MTEYEKKDKKGTFWMEHNSRAIWKGSIHHKDMLNRKEPDKPNEDGQKYYCVLRTEYKNETKYELMQSVGRLFLKNEKSHPRAPDIGGPVIVDLGKGTTEVQKFGAWFDEVTIKESGETKKILSCGLEDPRDKKPANDFEKFSSANEADEEMPF